MASIADITVYDGSASPVAHTLVAVDVTRENGKVVANWREQLAGVPVYAQVSYRTSIEKLKTGVYRISARAEVPVMETVSGQNAAGYTAAPKVAYTNTIEVLGYFHERSDIAGRRLVRQMAINMLGNVSTSVAAATTGPTPGLFDALISPT